MRRHYYAASTPQTAKQQSVVFPAAANPNLMKHYLGRQPRGNKDQKYSGTMQKTDWINYSTFLVWSGLDSIAVSLFGNMTVETGEMHIITKGCLVEIVKMKFDQYLCLNL